VAEQAADVRGPVRLADFTSSRKVAGRPTVPVYEKASAEARARIVRLSLDTLGAEPDFAPGRIVGDFSPECRRTAPAGVRPLGTRGWGNLDVWVQPLAGGEARP
jgi:hypothetical protein